MKFVFYMALGFVLIVIRTTVLLHFSALARAWDPVLILTVYLGLFHPRTGYMAAVVGLGYMVDTFSGAPFGFHIILGMAVYLFTSLLRDRFFVESTFFRATYTGAMTVAHGLLGGAVYSMITSHPGGGFAFGETVIRAVANGLIAAVLFSLLQRLESEWAPLSERRRAGITID